MSPPFPRCCGQPRRLPLHFLFSYGQLSCFTSLAWTQVGKTERKLWFGNDMILFLGSDCGPNNREMHEQIKVVARRIVRFVFLYVSFVIDMQTDLAAAVSCYFPKRHSTNCSRSSPPRGNSLPGGASRIPGRRGRSERDVVEAACWASGWPCR